MPDRARIYYHKFTTCPDCHEPHKSGKPLKYTLNNNFMCTSCKSIFRGSIDFVNNGYLNFDNTIKMVNNGHSENYLSRFPLVWRVEPNIIENEYLKWIKTIDGGKFLITWPWRRVKFLPLLISEYYLSSKKNGNIAVIYNPLEQVKDEINEPDAYEAFNNVFYIDGPADIADNKIQEEIKRFDKKHIFQKVKVTHYRIKENGKGTVRDDICTCSLRSCVNKNVKYINKCYGDGHIRNIIKNRLNRGRSTEVLNERGHIDLIFEERLQRTGKLNYKKIWIWEVLANCRKIKTLKTIIPNVLIRYEDKKIPECKGTLFMIPSTIDLSDIYDIIDRINPGFLIIEDVDSFTRDIYSNYTHALSIPEYVKQSNIPLVMMFSTDPSIRNIYAINSPDNRLKEEYGITVHTWDSELILSRLSAKYNNADSYPSPVSSLFVKPDEITDMPDIEYEGIKQLDELDEIKSIIGSLEIDEYLKTDMIEYLKRLKISTLKLKGDYMDNDVFKYPGNDEITYDILMNYLRQNISRDQYNYIMKIFGSIFAESGSYISPVMGSINKHIENIATTDPEAFITIITYYTSGTKKLLENHGIKNHVYVCSWNKLNKREASIPENTEHYVISTLPPSLQYSLYRGNINKLIFVGSQENIDLIKTNMENRLSINKSKPLYKPDGNGNYPGLLKEIMEDINTPSNSIISKILDFEVYSGVYDNQSKSTGNYSYLKSGEKAYLVINEDENGILIPENAQLTINKYGTPDILDMGKIHEKDIAGKVEGSELFLDSRGISISIKDIFLTFMIGYNDTIRFRSEFYIWNGFIDLYNSSTLWIRKIEEAVEKCKVQKNIDADCDNYISGYLAKQGLIAENPEYIKKWWTQYSIINVGGNNYKVYNIGHPKSMGDIERICNGLNKIYLSLKLDIMEMEKSYIAARTIQRIRRSLWDYYIYGNKIKYDLLPACVYEYIKKRIEPIFANSRTFKVKKIYPVEITEDTMPFKIMEKSEYAKLSKFINH